jgi:hypothetical protein
MADRLYPRLRRVACVALGCPSAGEFHPRRVTVPSLPRGMLTSGALRHCGTTPAELVKTMALLSELLKIATPILRPCVSAKAVPKRGARLVLEEV